MFIKDSKFYRSLLAICIPIALQNLITQATGLLDSLMLGAADESGILLSAASLGNNPFFILSVLCFGVASGASVLTAQYYGKGEMGVIRVIISMILKVGAFFGLLFAAAVLIFPKGVMSIFSGDEAIIAAGASYLRIIGIAYPFYAFGCTLLCSLRSIEILKISVITNLTAFFTNVFLNWVFIFGNLGMPAMGIKGAALATVFARLVEFAIVVFYVFFYDKKLSFRFSHLKLYNPVLAKDLLKYSTPVCANELMWSLAISAQSAILGHITYSAADPVAANTIASTISQIASIVMIGIANAAAVVIGKSIGEKRHREALDEAYTLKIISVILGVFSFVAIIVLRPIVVSFYALEENVIALANDLILVMAVVSIFSCISCVSLMGILRSAGDTRFCLVVEMVMLWLFAIPLAYLGSYFMLPVPIVLMLMKIDEPLKTVACLIRMRGKKWFNSVTREAID